ncbi:uncharacterized protein ASPGLDRAFT_29341 [Aspergillus glaucus CBS 516.65]|uniref:BTB domain-containing protein n=1 Tax=Aspergillus glaucus CBS 516.65 TaxID=1160497 RepID=A0A1L9V825_ASPGL|nr:hypothetical protein ASPGLDRAFT_29341 [Aspergillus glaucus CBS 516.65]OJJ80061.1 hypothetical protein ASPGLDRAFT_29341 [Aspergillus glaucus CBS 516.65]
MYGFNASNQSGKTRYEQRPSSPRVKCTICAVYTNRIYDAKVNFTNPPPTAIRPTKPTDLIILGESTTPARSPTPVDAAAETESIAKVKLVMGNHDPETHKSRFRVSSTKLMLASVKFGKILFPGWDYGSKALTQPEVYDIDQNAFSIMLNIIYCRTQVPHSIDLGMLTKLAVLTDYFGCHEALEPYPSIWLEGLKDEVPTTFSDELIKWICISWAFNYDDVFTKVTRIAQRQAPNYLDLLNLPISVCL